MEIKKGDIIEFIIGLINDFADSAGLSERQAFLYLRNHDAIEFIERNYGVLHTLSTEDNIESLKIFCRKEGGEL